MASNKSNVTIVPGIKKPTWTSLTIEALHTMEIPLNARELCDLTGAAHGQMAAALHWLHKTRVVGQCGTRDGETLWALTGSDDRCYSKDMTTTHNKVVTHPSPRKHRQTGKYFNRTSKTLGTNHQGEAE